MGSDEGFANLTIDIYATEICSDAARPNHGKTCALLLRNKNPTRQPGIFDKALGPPGRAFMRHRLSHHWTILSPDKSATHGETR